MKKRINLENLTRKNFGKRGSITVEACFIIPIILICLYFILYMAMLQYQKITVKAVSDRAVKMAALTWDNPNRQIETGEVKNINDYYSEKLYRNVFDEKEAKLNDLTTYLYEKIKDNSIFPPEKDDILVNCSMKNYIFYKELIIDIKLAYKTPISNCFSNLGINNSIQIENTSQALIKDPKELLNNTDMIIDEIKRNGLDTKIEKSYSKITDIFKPLTDNFERLKSSFGDIF